MQVEEVSVVEELLHEALAGIDPAIVVDLERLWHGSTGEPPSWVWSEPAPAPDPEEAARRQARWAAGPSGDSAGAAAGGEVAARADAGAGSDDVSWTAPGTAHERSNAAVRPKVSLSSDPGDAVAALLAALDAVAAQDPSSLPPGQALARSRALLKAGERLKAVSLEALADVETRSLHALDDSPTLSSWVSALDVPGVDGREVTLSRRLQRVPLVRKELRAGRMCSRTAAALAAAVATARPFLDRPDGLVDGLDGEQVLDGVLVDGITTLLAEQVGGASDAEVRLAALREELAELNDPARTQRERWEAALVVFARETDPALLSSGIGLLVDALLPGEHDKRAQQAEDARGFDLHRTPGSGWRAAGDLDDLTGEMLATVLAATSATDPDGPQDTRRAGEGKRALDDETLPPHQWPVDQPAPRSKRQQRHDALKRGLRALLDSGVLGVRGKVVPHVAVTVSLDLVEGVPGSLPARSQHGARLSRQQVRELLCRSSFTRLVLDARRRVVQASHSQRTSTAFERLVLGVQGGGVCAGAGCARGPATGHRLIPHHGSLFSRTGTTDLDDTVPLCEPHHDHDLHDQGRHLTLKDGRVLGPQGWVRP